MKNIVLIGMPGAGKSTIGKCLAEKLGMTFMDTDDVISQRQRKPLHQILEETGKEEFLKLEEAIVCSITCPECVIATGGSVVLSQRAMQHLKQKANIVYLEVDVDTLVRRIRDMSARGIAMGQGQSFNGLYLERKPLYERYADIRIEYRGQTKDQIVDQIIKLVSLSL